MAVPAHIRNPAPPGEDNAASIAAAEPIAPPSAPRAAHPRSSGDEGGREPPPPPGRLRFPSSMPRAGAWPPRGNRGRGLSPSEA